MPAELPYLAVPGESRESGVPTRGVSEVMILPFMALIARRFAEKKCADEWKLTDE